MSESFRRAFLSLTLVAGLPILAAGACSSKSALPPHLLGGAGSGGGSSTGTCASSAGGGLGLMNIPQSEDPTTCADAAANKTYIGCDFWPTPVANDVWSIFDFAAVVANAGTETATVTVSRKGATVDTVEVGPNALATIYLPWVPEIKGQDADTCGNVVAFPASVAAMGAAYHLVSSVPVTVFQFNALEYQGAGGPPGKDWSTCPGDQLCESPQGNYRSGCFSFTNDASLLLPTTALTGNYRITSERDWSDPLVMEGAYMAITGTAPDTSVTVYVAPGGHIKAGGALAETLGGGQLTFTLGAGDVVELVSDGNSDIAGSLVKASAPVQVISGMPCAFQPFDEADPACDHLEQTVFPAETLGKHYFVTVPTAPHGRVIGHIVRIVGNVDGTQITYPSGNAPAGAPTTLNAGQVADLGVVSQNFEIAGDQAFAVVTFMLGATIIDPAEVPSLGDPSQSNSAAVEQYRQKYVFLAPTDYLESYADIVQPMDASVTIDGSSLCTAPTPIGSGFGIARIPLGMGNDGAHVLTASAPVGLQVIGYGAYTSYQYPGGLNLKVLAAAPPPPN